jgi:hypothetical protein
MRNEERDKLMSHFSPKLSLTFESLSCEMNHRVFKKSVEDKLYGKKGKLSLTALIAHNL